MPEGSLIDLQSSNLTGSSKQLLYSCNWSWEKNRSNNISKSDITTIRFLIVLIKMNVGYIEWILSG